MTQLANPYWDEVCAHVDPNDAFYGPCVGRLGLAELRAATAGDPEPMLAKPQRADLVSKYAWTITDPASVAFVAEHAHGSLVDPMAGTGYWGYVLGQCGVQVASSDAFGPTENHWHHDYDLWVPVEICDGAEAVARHSDKTLLLSWPPYSEDVGTRILAAYHGDRVIFIGESDGGCTGDEDLHTALQTDWHEVACHRPVQWWGLHDYITVYERDQDAVELVRHALEGELVSAGR